MTTSGLQPIIRQASLDDSASIASVSVQAWQESYKGIIDQNLLDTLSVEKRFEGRLQIFKNTMPKSSQRHFVAEFENQIIGFCDAGPSRSDRATTDLARGEIYAIYVLSAYKGLKVGYQLFCAAASFLRAEELCPYIAWALVENHSARTFYERQGGHICAEGTYTATGKAYPEVCYLFT